MFALIKNNIVSLETSDVYYIKDSNYTISGFVPHDMGIIAEVYNGDGCYILMLDKELEIVRKIDDCILVCASEDGFVCMCEGCENIPVLNFMSDEILEIEDKFYSDFDNWTKVRFDFFKYLIKNNMSIEQGLKKFDGYIPQFINGEIFIERQFDRDVLYHVRNKYYLTNARHVYYLSNGYLVLMFEDVIAFYKNKKILDVVDINAKFSFQCDPCTLKFIHNTEQFDLRLIFPKPRILNKYEDVTFIF